MVLPPDASAAAAVAALFFAATLLAPLNFKLTGKGFHLYIPLGISTAMRGVAHAARSSYFVGHNIDLMAVYGALNAAGFGIAVAMCCCFTVIWLRNAFHHQAPRVAKRLSTASACLVACVIAFGPVLGVVAAGVVFGSGPGNLAAMEHGQHIRLASSAGFTAVSATASLICCYLAITWLIAGRSSSSSSSATASRPDTHHHQQQQQQEGEDPPQQQQQQQQRRQRRQPQDGLIFVLVACLLLLTWTAAARLAQYDHPALLMSSHLYYTVSVLPELIVAYVFAVPTLAARVALGRRYAAWLKQRQQQGGSGGVEGNGGVSDAQVGIDHVQMCSKA